MPEPMAMSGCSSRRSKTMYEGGAYGSALQGVLWEPGLFCFECVRKQCALSVLATTEKRTEEVSLYVIV